MFDASIDDWFYAAKKLRPALEKAALANVKSWVWMKGLVCGLDPEPYRWQARGFGIARPVPKPGSSKAARKGHFECGLDAQERMVVQRQYTGEAAPYLDLFFYLPKTIRVVRYAAVDWAWTAPEWVRELKLTSGRVVEARLYSNEAMWPERPLTAKDVKALKQEDTVETHQRFTWKRDRIDRIEDRAGKGWVLSRRLDYRADGKLLRIWRPNHTRASGKEVMWGEKF